MSGREWKPGDVALVTWDNASLAAKATGHSDVTTKVALLAEERWVFDTYSCIDADSASIRDLRPLVVIDPKDPEQVERLSDLISAAGSIATPLLARALREFANPAPEEPTDPTTRVTDRRENIWRLLADGDWVCVDGPDIGEYLTWDGLTERGPLTIEATS